jgi:peptidoglycan/xylan/chitin deacetylase (PgdA/CDA1 family)
VLATLFATSLLASGPPTSAASCSTLVYHRFGDTAADSMTTTTALFVQQLTQLRAHGYGIAPLAYLVASLSPGHGQAGKLIAITVDDGHRSVFFDLFPAIQHLNVPVTLFIYPSAISNAPYALTWDQLRTMTASTLVSIGAHTYWHPDFRAERRRLTPEAYTRFVQFQLARPRAALHERLGANVTFLAWPYGISDEVLRRAAQDSGYTAAFALGNRNASDKDPLYALPRHMVVDAVGGQALLARVARGPACTP